MTGSKAEKTLSVLQVRDQCYTLLDEIGCTGKSMLTTRMGKPFVELRPIRSRRTRRKPVAKEQPHGNSAT
jgi:hypothetical protein